MIAVIAGIIINIFIFFAVGFLPMYLLSPSRDRWVTSIALAPTMGFAITSIVATYLILLDFPVKSWANTYGIVSIFLSLSVFSYLVIKKKITFGDSNLIRRDVVWVFIGFFIVAIITALPMILKGSNFTVLRGNGGDSFNYMTMAGYLDREYFSWKDTAPPSEIMDKDRSYHLAVSLLDSRWTTSAVLAYTARVAGLPIYQFEYPYTLLFFILSFGPCYLMGLRLNLNRLYAFLVAMIISIGFWGQFVLDTRAFSQINSIPLVLSIGCLFVCAVDLMEEKILRMGVLLGVLGVSLVFSYIEIVILYVLSGVIFLSLSLKKWRGNWLTVMKLLGVMVVIVVIGSVPLYHLLINFFLNQINFAATIANDWHKYYFSWLYSNPFIGFWGLTPLTFFSYCPNLKVLSSIVVILLTSMGGMLFLIGTIFGAKVLFDKKSNTYTIFVISFIIASAAEFLFLFIKGNLWAAGKALAFGYPFFTFLPVVAVFSVSKFPIRTLIGKLFKFIVIFWVAIQIILGVARNYVAITGVEFVSYIVNHGGYRRHDYDLSPMYSVLKNTDEKDIWMVISDPWLSEYTNLVLGSNHHVVNMLGIYDRNGNFIRSQGMRERPRFIVADRVALSYNLHWKKMFSMVAQTPDLVLLEVKDPKFVFLLISNPNGIEELNGEVGFWIGSGTTVLNFISADAGQVLFEGNFIPGPSLSGTLQRRLEIMGNEDQVFDIYEGTKEFTFNVDRGNNQISLDSLDQPSIKNLPNGDPRILLLGITNISIRLVK